MSINRQRFDIPALDDVFAPPIDEARREELRNDPNVRFYQRTEPNLAPFKPSIHLAAPIEPSDLPDDCDNDNYMFEQ